MPPLRQPEQRRTLLLPARQAWLAAETDVMVVGGGPAGLGAALGAAAAGARVVLAERYGFLGGNATAALVMPLMSFHTHRPSLETKAAKLMPADHGPGEPVIAGVLRQLVERLVERDGAIRPSLATGYVVPFDPEVFKAVALEMLDDANVPFLLHAMATDFSPGSEWRGVVFETKSGTLAVEARLIVDCTGDGDIAARAGAEFEVGRDHDGLTQPMTLMFRIVGFDQDAFDNYVRQNPTQWRGVHGLWDLVRQAAEAGQLDLPREDILFFGTPHRHEVSVNSTRVGGVLGTNVFDLTCAEWEGRRQMQQVASFLKHYVPGFENSYIAQSGVNIGVRETRRIVGEYRLTAADLLSARQFDDVIARAAYPVDIHNPAGKGTILKRVPAGEAYDIPLRSLVPKGVEHVLLAGRAISGTYEAHSSYRVMPTSMATGQAAGVCAALCVKSGQSPREIDVRQVQGELLRQGANLKRR
jgi:FAD dependent oxidoreductase